MNRRETIVFCLAVGFGILYLRQFVEYPKEVVLFMKSLMMMVEELISAFGLLALADFINRIPFRILIFLFSLAQILFGSILVLGLQNRVNQGVMTILKNPGKVIKWGMILFICCFLCFLIFAYSIIGAPFGLFIFACCFICSSLGGIPLAIYVGYMVQERLQVPGYTFTYYILGSFIVMAAQSVYGIGSAFTLFILPVLSIGTFFVMVVNRHYFKLLYEVEFCETRKKEAFDRNKIREIIKKGLEDE